MISSEFTVRKKKILLVNSLNLLNTFLVKHGRKNPNFFIILNFLALLKKAEENRSPYQNFYNFISVLTPRVNITSIENKKAGKIFKIPMPPSINTLLEHNFLIKTLKEVRNKQKFKNLPVSLHRNYDELLLKKRGLLFKEWEEAYAILKQHKFRARKRHDKLIKKKKLKNVIKKSKQFYI
jgi:hypothetical protein